MRSTALRRSSSDVPPIPLTDTCTHTHTSALHVEYAE